MAIHQKKGSPASHSILAPNRHPAFETPNAIFPMYLVQQLIQFHLWLLNWLSSGETTFSK